MLGEAGGLGSEHILSHLLCVQSPVNKICYSLNWWKTFGVLARYVIPVMIYAFEDLLINIKDAGEMHMPLYESVPLNIYGAFHPCRSYQ